MLRLTSSFVLGYHGCDAAVANKLLEGEPFKASRNDYDWLGAGTYFWEANPYRGLDFAAESTRRRAASVQVPAVVGAVIDLGLCLDLMTTDGLRLVRDAHLSLVETYMDAGSRLPENHGKLHRQLDCAVIEHVHAIYDGANAAIDTVRGVFVEGAPIYPGAAFHTKTHIQIAVRNLACIKGVFRVPREHLPAG